MAKAIVKDGVLYIEVPFDKEGSATTSRKNTLHATTEMGTPDALVITEGGKKITIQVNAYSKREPKEAPVKK